MRQRHRAESNRFSSALLFATVALAPLPFGSTDRPIIAVWCVVLGVALVCASPVGLSRPRLIPLGALAFVTLVYLFVIYAQLTAHPWLPVSSGPVWDQAGRLLGVPVEPSVSTVRNEPFFAAGPPLAAMLSLGLSYIVCSDRHRARQLLRVVAWSGAAYALLGIVLFIADPTKVLWREKLAYTSSLTSTFTNRNTAGVYFGSCAVVAFLLLLQWLKDNLPYASFKAQTLLASPGLLFRLDSLQLIFKLLICLTAMLMTGSRAGVVFSLVGIIVAFAAFHWRRGIGGRAALFATLAAVTVVVALLQVFGGGVENRFNENGVSDPARLETYKSTLKMIADHPWIGTGLGSYVWTFPAYRSNDAPIWGVWDRAHDTLLEIAAELGVPFALLVVAAWSLIFWRLWCGIRTRRRDLVIPVAAFSVGIIGVLHSIIDFSLQITGFAILTFALVGAGLAQSYSSMERQ